MIDAVELERRYGPRVALRPVTFSVAAGQTMVVTGPNGSGKTTLLRLVAGLLAPTRGRIGVQADRHQLGFLAHESLLYRDLTALENLDLYGRLYRVHERRERIGMLLERFGLWEARGERVVALSRGMTQRLALCRILLHDPTLLVLDEPHTALDDAGVSLLDGLLAELSGRTTMLVATHDPRRLRPIASAELALA